MRSWPVRRWVATAVATPLLSAVLAGFGWPSQPGVLLIALTIGAAILGGLIVASYVPVTGRGIDLGCGSCAIMSGVTVLGAMVAMSTYPGSLLGPIGAATLMTFGLTRRLNQPSACAATTSSSGPSERERAPELNEH